ncbi:response regulator [Luteococcus sp.]|uniref:response regulator n=1 Tax=Luteococcus sp. TaxID=1969402 RepID=UPI003734EEF5
MNRITVAVADDQPLLVSAFVALVDAQPDMVVVGRARDGAEAVEVARREQPDVMLMDLRMPVMDGVEATRQIVQAGARPHVLVLTTFNMEDLVREALTAGARGFLLKDAEPELVLDGIRRLHDGRAVLDPAVAHHVVAAVRSTASRASVDERLTPRETDVLRLIAKGLTNAEIAAELVVAETTIKTHVGNLLMKLQARDRVALVVQAFAMGLAEPGDLPAHQPHP